MVELRSLVVAGTPKISFRRLISWRLQVGQRLPGWRRDELAELQCSRCGLHGAVSIIIPFRAYNLTPRELQVVNEPAAIWYSIQDPQAG